MAIERIEINVQTGERKIIKVSNDEIAAMQAAEDARIAAISYTEKRVAEYPPMTDYLDGIVKGDKEQVQIYIDACKAVKAKYPKPTA